MPHPVKMVLVLAEPFFSDLEHELLTDSVASKVPLHDFCMLIFVQLDHLENVTVVLGSSPSVLDPACSLYSIRQHFHVADLADHSSRLRLNAHGSSRFLFYLVASFQLDQ